MNTMGKRVLSALVAAALLGPAVGQSARALAEEEAQPTEETQQMAEEEQSTDEASQPESPEIDSRYLTLASASYPLTKKDVPEGLKTLESRRMDDNGSYLGGVYLASNTEIQVVEAVAHAILRMFNDAESEGVILYVRQGYRSYEEEKKRYDRLVARGMDAQKPGECDYQTGLAVTVVGKAWRAKTLTEEFAATEEAQWLRQHCSRYGFVLRYPEGKEDVTGWNSEPWHLRYVGIEAAEYMQQHNLCLEEFIELLGIEIVPAMRDEDESGESETNERKAENTVPPEPTPIPAGVLEEYGPDGDYEITLFHD